MNKRDSDILNELISAQGAVTISQLAQTYEVTERTVRNDLKTIDEILKLNQLPVLNLHSNGVVSYYGDKKAVLKLIQCNDFYDYKLSQEERQIAICLILLLAGGYVTLAAVSQELFVSRTTLIGDMSRVKAFLKERNLTVESHPNKGIRVLGREREMRRCILNIILTKIGPTMIGPGNCSPFYKMVLTLIDRSEQDKKLLEQIIKTEEQKNHLRYTDSSFLSILYYLVIAVGRMKSGFYAEKEKKGQAEQHPIAREMLAFAMDYFKLPLLEGEVEFLGEILNALNSVRALPYNENIVEIQIMTSKFIRRISEDLGYDLTSDFTFYENLEKHLQTTLIQRFVSIPQNSAADLIEKNYPDILRETQKEITLLKGRESREIDYNEVSFIAMHVCAAVERKKNQRVPAKVIVVCGGGVGTSELLAEQLKKRFHFEIMSVIAAHNADILADTSADLVISTVPLDRTDFDYILVSPLLNDEDYLKICRRLDSLPKNGKAADTGVRYGASSLMRCLNPVVNELMSDKAAANVLCDSLERAARRYFGEREEKKIPSLSQLITVDKIRLNVVCADCFDAIRQSAQSLLEQGYIESRYIASIFQNMEENGPYFVLSKGFAVPHAEIGSGTLKTGMSLIRLARPVAFGSDEFDPVEYVCCLSAVDSESHLKAFFNLVNLLRNEEFKNQLREAPTPEAANLVIRTWESNLLEKRESYHDMANIK